MTGKLTCKLPDFDWYALSLWCASNLDRKMEFYPQDGYAEFTSENDLKKFKKYWNIE